MISTYPGTYKSPWSRVMAKNPPGELQEAVHAPAAFISLTDAILESVAASPAAGLEKAQHLMERLRCACLPTSPHISPHLPTSPHPNLTLTLTLT